MLRSRVKAVLSFGLLANLLGILQSVILARLLGPESRGELALPLTFVLLVLPLSSFGVKQNLAYLEGKKREYVSGSDLTKLIALCVGFTFFFTVLYAFIYLSSLEVLAFQVFSLILVRALTDMFSYKLLVLKKAHKLTRLSFYRSIIEISLIIYLYFSQVRDLNTILNVFIFTYLTYGLLIIYVSFLITKKCESSNANANAKFSYGKFLKKGLAFSIPLFLININVSFDVLMLAKLASSKSVGIYQVAVSVANMLWVLPTLLGGLIFSESLGRKLPDLVDKLVVFYRYLFIGVIIMIVPILLSKWLFITVFGEAFGQSAEVFNILLLGYYAMIIYKLSNGVFASHGLVKVPLLIFSFSAFFNIGLNLWLIPQYMHKGAAVSTLVSYLCCAAMFYFYTDIVKKNNAKKISI